MSTTSATTPGPSCTPAALPAHRRSAAPDGPGHAARTASSGRPRCRSGARRDAPREDLPDTASQPDPRRPRRRSPGTPMPARCGSRPPRPCSRFLAKGRGLPKPRATRGRQRLLEAIELPSQTVPHALQPIPLALQAIRILLEVVLLAAQLVGFTPQALVLAPQAVALRLRATRGILVPTGSTGATLVRHTQVMPYCKSTRYFRVSVGDSLHPLDAALNLPPERYSLEVRRRVAEAAASRPFDETLFNLSRSAGAEVPKRQAEQLVVRAAHAQRFAVRIRGSTCCLRRQRIQRLSAGTILRAASRTASATASACSAAKPTAGARSGSAPVAATDAEPHMSRRV